MRCSTGQLSRPGPLRPLIGLALAATVMWPFVFATETAVAGEAASDDRPSGAAPPTPKRGTEPERDQDVGERPRTGPQIRPRSRDDADPAPRSDDGCPYRGRKLDLIV